MSVSHTVNPGDDVTLTVSVTDPERTSTRWRKNASSPESTYDDKLSLKIPTADQLGNAGNYEIHFAGQRASGKQALMRLIVRGEDPLSEEA